MATWSDFIALYCRRRNYCTKMDFDQYSTMLHYVDGKQRLGEFLTDVLKQIVPMIWICSENPATISEIQNELFDLWMGRTNG